MNENPNPCENPERPIGFAASTDSEWVMCADAMPDDDFDCEIRYEDGSTGFGLYTGNDPHALDGWMCDVTHQMTTGPKDNGAVVAWRKLPRL